MRSASRRYSLPATSGFGCSIQLMPTAPFGGGQAPRPAVYDGPMPETTPPRGDASHTGGVPVAGTPSSGMVRDASLVVRAGWAAGRFEPQGAPPAPQSWGEQDAGSRRAADWR